MASSRMAQLDRRHRALDRDARSARRERQPLRPRQADSLLRAVRGVRGRRRPARVRPPLPPDIRRQIGIVDPLLLAFGVINVFVVLLDQSVARRSHPRSVPEHRAGRDHHRALRARGDAVPAGTSAGDDRRRRGGPRLCAAGHAGQSVCRPRDSDREAVPRRPLGDDRRQGRPGQRDHVAGDEDPHQGRQLRHRAQQRAGARHDHQLLRADARHAARGRGRRQLRHAAERGEGGDPRRDSRRAAHPARAASPKCSWSISARRRSSTASASGRPTSPPTNASAIACARGSTTRSAASGSTSRIPIQVQIEQAARSARQTDDRAARTLDARRDLRVAQRPDSGASWRTRRAWRSTPRARSIVREGDAGQLDVRDVARRGDRDARRRRRRGRPAAARAPSSARCRC